MSACAASLLVLSLAACGDEEKKAASPTTWSDQGAANASDKAGEKGQDAKYKVVPGEAWQLSLPAGGTSATVDPASWPDVQQILSNDQLNGIFPGKSLTRPSLCATGSFGGGTSTPKNTQCSWEISLSFSEKPRIRLQLKGIGADSEVIKAWDATREAYRKEATQDDSFYKDGTYGARRVLLRNSGLGSFVVSDGQVAAWFEIQVPDAGFIVEGDAPKTKEQFRTLAFPTLVETFVTFLPRKH